MYRLRVLHFKEISLLSKVKKRYFPFCVAINKVCNYTVPQRFIQPEFETISSINPQFPPFPRRNDKLIPSWR